MIRKTIMVNEETDNKIRGIASMMEISYTAALRLIINEGMSEAHRKIGELDQKQWEEKNQKNLFIP